MRTTLSIDDRALAAARSRARERGISVGEALSELALVGYEVESSALGLPRAEFPVLPAVPGHVITDDMVADALDEQ